MSFERLHPRGRVRRLYVGVYALNLVLAACGAQPSAGGRGSPPAEAGAGTELPAASRIPDGIYTGDIEVSFTLEADGKPTTRTETLPLSLRIVGGRLQTAVGVDFAIGGTYSQDFNPMFITATLSSVWADENQIVLRFNLNVEVDLGDVRGDFTGTQTDTLTFFADSGVLELVRTQYYGGVGSDGTVVTARSTGNADLRQE